MYKIQFQTKLLLFEAFNWKLFKCAIHVLVLHTMWQYTTHVCGYYNTHIVSSSLPLFTSTERRNLIQIYFPSSSFLPACNKQKGGLFAVYSTLLSFFLHKKLQHFCRSLEGWSILLYTETDYMHISSAILLILQKRKKREIKVMAAFVEIFLCSLLTQLL